VQPARSTISSSIHVRVTCFSEGVGVQENVMSFAVARIGTVRRSNRSTSIVVGGCGEPARRGAGGQVSVLPRLEACDANRSGCARQAAIIVANLLKTLASSVDVQNNSSLDGHVEENDPGIRLPLRDPGWQPEKARSNKLPDQFAKREPGRTMSDWLRAVEIQPIHAPCGLQKTQCCFSSSGQFRKVGVPRKVSVRPPGNKLVDGLDFRRFRPRFDGIGRRLPCHCT